MLQTRVFQQEGKDVFAIENINFTA